MTKDPVFADMPLFAVNLRWPCGHARTERNTQAVGKAGVRCRICRQVIAREYGRRMRKRVAEARALEAGGHG